MKTKWITEQFAYDGSQLRSLFAYENYGVQGDSIVSWVGACDIPDDKIVDVEDLRAGDSIAGSEMLHFIAELFGQTLPATVALQRLVMANVSDLLGEEVVRDGDDLFVKNGKLSISIATLSPVSGLIHFALNIRNEGTPVETSCLQDLNVDPSEFAQKVLQSVSKEWVELLSAGHKVKWVK